ncbi:MAG: CPBP family intramembrane metalloprotease [Anaerolineaceae bacterium]|nr:MAG: CPBP family intramembrane metalloprotease [Anaerolineaceae bacterium]
MKQLSPQSRIAIYLIFLLLATIAANVIAARLTDSPVAGLILMTSPALAALLASLVTRHSLIDIGWRVTPIKWLGLGWILPILYAMPAYAVLWLTGLGGVPNPTFLERARFTLNMPDVPTHLLIPAAFFYITIINLLPSMLLSLGEEIGWRGFLVPELTKWLGVRNAAWLSGVIWAAWHFPGILSGEYGAQGTPLAYRLVCFTLMVFASGMVMAWLRMKSGSIIPVAIMHATHNGVIQTFLERITYNTGHTAYFTGEFGVALLPILLLMAWVVWKQMAKMESQVA